MLTRRCAVHRCVLAGLLFLSSLAGQRSCAPTAVYAQADSCRSNQRPAARPSVPAAAGTPATHELFRQQCVKRHGADGRGSAVRGALPEVPDFTDASWQGRRSDAQLPASILDGKGAGMPSGRGRVSEEQARDLVAYVRALDPPLKKSGQRERDKPATSDFEGRYRRLEQELGELRRQFQELSEEPPGSTPSKPSEPQQVGVVRLSAAAAARTPYWSLDSSAPQWSSGSNITPGYHELRSAPPGTCHIWGFSRSRGRGRRVNTAPTGRHPIPAKGERCAYLVS
jgi:mono/diheme cytochrome c family protein